MNLCISGTGAINERCRRVSHRSSKFPPNYTFMGKSGNKKIKRKKRSSTGSSTSPNEKKLKGISSEDEPHEEVETIATEMTATGSNVVVNVCLQFNQILERLDIADVAELNKTSTEHRQNIDADLDDFKVKTNEDIALLHKKLLYQEAYSCRENLKFLNISEQVENAGEGGHEVRENTKEAVYSFMEDKLQISDALKIEFQCLHRNGKTSGKKPRPILVCFLCFTDRERVLKHARNLKDTPCAIHEDLPYEIVECRRQQIKKLKRARENGQTAYSSRSEPGKKLCINGQYVPM